MKKSGKARSLVKNVAPIKATSGPGFAVEDKVAAVCAAAILLGRSPFSEFPGRLVRIGFQVRPDGWHFDDALLTFERETGEYRAALSIRSKREISGQAISTDVKNAFAAQFGPIQLSPFKRGVDRLSLVAARHDDEVSAGVRSLCAAATGDTTALAGRIHEPGLFTSTARALYDDLQSHFITNKVSVDAATAFASFDLIEPNMDDFARSEPALGRQLCAELLHDPSEANVSGLWQALVAECQRQKHLPGYLDLERLLVVVRHRFWMKSYPHDAPDWEIIDRESKGQLELVVDTIAGVAVSRAKAMELLGKAVAAHPAIALVGPSGCGKSSLVKQFLSGSGHAVRVWTKASRWPEPQAGNLANALGLEGLTHDLSDLFRRVSGPGLLVIDAVEHCTDADRLAQLARVIRLARPDDKETPWRVALLVRAEDWSRVREELAKVAREIAVQVEPLGDFEAEDVGVIARAVPAVAPLVHQPRLETVLRKPKILSLVAEHVKVGGMVDVKDLAGESHLAQWWWKAYVRTGAKPALRVRALEELVAKQAERVQHAVHESEFDVALLDSFAELVRNGICVSRGEEFAVQHDLYADWTRFQLLIRQGEHWAAFAEARIASPLWHRAIRLYGIWLLEQPGGGAAAWSAQITSLSQKGDAPQLIGDLFLEAPLLSAAPAENLRAVWPNLVADGGNLLHRMLERMRQTGTFPHDGLIELLMREGGFPRGELVAHFRLPYPQYWLPLLIVLHEHLAESAVLAPVAVARVALAWLEMVPAGWPGRRQAAELAVAVAKPFVEGAHSEVWFAKSEEEEAIYQALLAAAHERPEEVARLARVLAGLLPPGGGQYTGKGKVRIKEGFGPGPGVTYELPPPWPGGPFVRPKSRFARLVLKTNAMNPIIVANPALARELLLATHIPEREAERGHGRDRYQPEGMVFDDSFQSPFYTRGSFLQLLTANREEGRRLVVDLVNHYTDRWIEWARGDGELTVGEGDGTQRWKGDGRLYLAYRGAAHCHPLVVSALMALEKHLLDRVDRGESIDEDVEYLLVNSRSLAIAGLLVALGKKVPSLLFTKLWAFVASPELQVTEFHSFHSFGRESGRPTNGRERELMDEWEKLTIHQVPLHEACRRCLPYTDAQPKLATLPAKWRRLLAEPDKLTVDAFTLHKLAELFDPANWTKKKEGEQEVWEYQPPPKLLEAAAKRSVERQSDLMPLLTVPISCRTLLDAGKALPDAKLEQWFARLDQLPDGTIKDDDGESIVASLADAQCAIVAVLVNLGRDWLDRHPQKAACCGAILLQHLAQPPPPRRFIFDSAPFNLIWENFCGEAAPYFLARDPENREWLAALAELASRPHLQTMRGLFRRAAEVQTQLGPLFSQLFDLAVWIAAARRVVDFTEHGMKPALDWDEWWKTKKEEFVEGKLLAPPPDWEMIDVGPSGGRHNDPRFGPKVKIGVIVAALEAMDLAGAPATTAERALRHGWKQRLLAAIVATRPKSVGKSGEPSLPSEPEVRAMLLLGAHVAQVEGSDERRTFWEPLLSRGLPAAHCIRYFLQGFLAAGARQPSTAFTNGWKEIVAWAEEAPGWKFAAIGPPQEMRSLWRGLLGLEETLGAAFGAIPTGIIAGMKEHYERWAGNDLDKSGSAQRFLNFLRQPAAVELLADGLGWLDRALDGPSERRWGFRELAPELSSFLQWAWTNHEKRIRAQPEAFAIFQRLLQCLGAEQNQAALALLSALTVSS